MARRYFLVAALLAAWCACSPLWAARSDLIPESTAAQHGLVRPWFAQVEFDQGRGNISGVLLYEGVLYVQTNSATLHAIDAETGKTLWSKQIGQPKYPSMPPDAKGDLLATINGSRLYILNRFSGDLLCDKEIKDAPGGGPALSSKRVYVPIVTGMIAAYRIESDDKATDASGKTKNAVAAANHSQTEAAPSQKVHISRKVAPVYCQSFGRALVQPLVTRDDSGGEYVVWPTDRGYLNLGRVSHEIENSMGVKYRLETGATIVTRPAYLPPDPKSLGDAGMVVAASCDGFLYAIQEESGETLWRFSTGEPIVEPPAVIDDRAYVATQLGSMYCLDSKTGKSVWRAEDVMRFVAATKARIYGTDDTGRLLVLNAASGARLDAMPIGQVSSVVANSDTDRIYLVSDGGLIQCLREVEQNQPLLHNKERKDAAKAGLTPLPEPKKEVEKPVKKEHAAARKPAEPKEPKEPKEIKKKEPKPKPPPRGPRNAGKKGAGGADGLDADEPIGKGRIPKPKKNKNGNNPL
jgi:outer membrane protein assembly factor BamB